MTLPNIRISEAMADSLKGTNLYKSLRCYTVLGETMKLPRTSDTIIITLAHASQLPFPRL